MRLKRGDYFLTWRCDLMRHCSRAEPRDENILPTIRARLLRDATIARQSSGAYMRSRAAAVASRAATGHNTVGRLPPPLQTTRRTALTFGLHFLFIVLLDAPVMSPPPLHLSPPSLLAFQVGLGVAAPTTLVSSGRPLFAASPSASLFSFDCFKSVKSSVGALLPPAALPGGSPRRFVCLFILVLRFFFGAVPAFLLLPLRPRLPLIALPCPRRSRVLLAEHLLL